MRVVRQLPPKVMIAEFLRAEYESRRFGKRIRSVLANKKLKTRVVTDPNVKNERENRLRREILSAARGYPRIEGGAGKLLFTGVPHDLKYFEVLISEKELANLRFINHEHWRSPDDRERRVSTAAAALARRRTHHAFEDLRAVRRLLRAGRRFGPPLLVATSRNAKKFVVLEGNIRIAALYLEKIKGPHQVMLGVSRGVKSMLYY